MQSNQQDNLDKLRARLDVLLDDGLPFAAFCRDLAATVGTIEDLPAVAIIAFANQQPPQVIAEYNLKSISQDGFFSLDPEHQSYLIDAMRQQKMLTIVDRSVPEAGLRDHSILIQPVRTAEAPVLALELFTYHVPDAGESAHLREVSENAKAYINRFIEEQVAGKKSHQPDDFWKLFDVFLVKLQQSLDLKQTVNVAVNDGRTLIGCDRVGIAVKRGNKTEIIGISGQEGVQQRANLVAALADIAKVVIQLGCPVTYRGNLEGLPPNLVAPLAEYLAISRTRMVMMIPLREPADLIKDDVEITGEEKPRERKIFGCLFIEQAIDQRPKPIVVERTDLLSDHIETAVNNALQHESIFLLPVWRAIGRGIRWFRGRRVWIAAAILAGCTVVGLGLALIPWDYRVEGTGQAMPAIQHEVFAPWDGDVLEVLVESGDNVKVGDVLIRLESDELDAQKITIVQQLQELEKQRLFHQETIRKAGRSGEETEKLRAEGELSKTIAELEGAQSQLKKINSRIEKLIVRSPANGVVATFQLRQLLQNRPVQRGELLLEVMQPEGPWRLELEVPEYRMGHLVRALQKSESKTLPVEYVLATHVETSHDGIMSEIATRSNESEEEGTIFEVYADIDKSDLPNQNIGADVTAKINCGPKSLFYVLFGDVVEFLQRNLWL